MRHPTDGNAIAADAYYDQPDDIGNEDGETCNRVDPPDEGNPNPNPCNGVMIDGVDDAAGWTYCDTCGEIGD